MQNTQEYQVEWMRRQYYNHLSFIDILARSFGESSFLMKSILFSSSLTMSSLFYINPYFLLVGFIFTSFFFILNTHYRAMENRLDKLLDNIKLTELELNDFKQKSQDFANTAKEGIQKNQEIVQQLEETRAELNELQGKFNQTLQNANDSCQHLIESADHVKNHKDNLSICANDAESKINALVKEIDITTQVIKTVLPKHKEFLESEDRIDALIKETETMHSHFLEKYGQEFFDFKRKMVEGRGQGNSFFNSASSTKDDIGKQAHVSGAELV